MTVSQMTEAFLLNMGYSRADAAEPDVVEEYAPSLARWLNEGYARAVQRLCGREAAEAIAPLRGGADGLDFYRAIAGYWTAALRVGGRLLFEVGIGQADEVLRIMRSVGFGDLEITPDLNGIPRVVEGVLCSEL